MRPSKRQIPLIAQQIFPPGLPNGRGKELQARAGTSPSSRMQGQISLPEDSSIICQAEGFLKSQRLFLLRVFSLLTDMT